MSLALRAPHPPVPWRPEQNDRKLALVVRDLLWSSTRLFPYGNGIVLNDRPLVYDLLLHWHTHGNCLCIQTAQNQFGAMALVAPVELQVPTGCRGTAACGCDTGTLIPTLPLFQCVLCQFTAECFVQQAASPSFAWRQSFDCSGLHHSTCGAKKYRVRSIHRHQVPSLLNSESRRPRRRFDGCKGTHHTRSPNCAKGGTARVLSCRPTANRRCMLAAYGTSHINRSWSAGTSANEADSTASLIDLTSPLTTFTELSAAPLDCGSPSADVSHIASPVQATFTALSSDRMEVSLPTPL